MLTCVEATCLAKQFDNSESCPVVTCTPKDSDSNGSCGVMGKELLASATEYVRIFLLSGLFDSSGSGAVAIDNKIEQAMDLVKSHLMFAVREEVDLLKEKIKELLERNDQLIRENSFLREHAAPDTLLLLNSSSVSPQ